MVNYEFLNCSGKCMYNVLIVVDIYCDVCGIWGFYIWGLYVFGLGGCFGVDYGGCYYFGYFYYYVVLS